MGQRLDLDTLLKGILGSDAVYFQPPAAASMVYPCFVYNRDDVEVQHGDNKSYSMAFKYQITLISKTPSSEETIKKVLDLPLCSYDRFFRASSLNHDVFNLYF